MFRAPAHSSLRIRLRIISAIRSALAAMASGSLRRAHNIKVGVRTAEQIKMHVGSALTELENPPEDYVVHGPNLMTSLPLEVPVSYQEIADNSYPAYYSRLLDLS